MYRMKDNTVVDLLHPDLLSTAVLEELLRERRISEERLSWATRDDLLYLYSKVVLPLPQREHRKNRRGAFLVRKGGNAIQEQPTVSQVSVSPVPCPEPQARIKLAPPVINKAIDLHSVQPHSRLKPPPISAEYVKVIKLNSRATNGDSIMSPKRPTSPPVVRPKLIRLNRPPPPPQNNKSKDGHSDESIDPAPPKKKHKPILWP